MAAHSHPDSRTCRFRPFLTVIPLLCAALWAALLLGPVTNARAATPILDVSISQGWPAIGGSSFSPGWTGEVTVQSLPGGPQVWSRAVTADGNGDFMIEPPDLVVTLGPGMVVAAKDGLGTVKQVTLATLTFAPMDGTTDVASGTAPAGAQVTVNVWRDGAGDKMLTVAADGAGKWSADFGAAGFHIAWGTDGDACVRDEDGDATRTSPAAAPWIYAGNSAGICGSSFAANADVTITVTDGATTVFSGKAPTDDQGWFDLGDPLGFTLAPGMHVVVTDGIWTKELTLRPLSFDLLDPADETATGTGPPGETVLVDVSSDDASASASVVVAGDGTWTASFAPFNVTSAMNGGAGVRDVDGDETRDEWYHPVVQANLSTNGWGDGISGDGYEPGSTVAVWLYASAARGTPLMAETAPIDEGGSFWIPTQPSDLLPGMRVVVTDPYTTLTRSLVVKDVWVDELDPVADTVAGTGPAGSEVGVRVNAQSGDTLGEWRAKADSGRKWSVACGLDVTWLSWCELWLADADGDQTQTEGSPRAVQCDLVTDRISGRAFTRGGTLTVQVRSASSVLLWSGSAAVDGNGLFVLDRATHGRDLVAGLKVRVIDVPAGTTKDVALPALTFDDLDPVKDVASGTGPAGATVVLGGHGQEWAGEIGSAVVDALGRWSVDVGAGGGAVDDDMTADVVLQDADADWTSVPFVPHLDALTSSTHPSQSAWYAKSSPTFSWTPSPGSAGFSFVLDHSAATVPDQVSEGTARTKSFSGLADGVWYFHVRAVGGLGIYGVGPLLWGRTSHFKVQIDTVAPALASLTSGTHPVATTWYPATAATFGWAPAAGGAPVTGYSWSLDQTAATTPDQTVDGTATTRTLPIPTDGVWYFHVRAVDAAGNWGPALHRAVRRDASAPSIASLSSTTHPVEATWYLSNAPSLSWGAGDTSGISGYSYVLDHVAGTVPDMTSEGAATSRAYSGLADGLWYFHVRARNGAGLWGPARTRAVRIDATPTITVTTPTATSSWPSGSAQTVAWTVAPTVATGEFRIWLVSASGKWYLDKQVLPTAGKGSYAVSVTAAVPAGSGYRAYVYWRPAIGNGAWMGMGKSAAFTVTPINIVSPVATSVWRAGSTQNLVWTVNPAFSSGEFRVGLVNAAGTSWYSATQVLPVAGKTSYARALQVSCPAGSGYRAYVYWRPTVGSGTWTVTAKSAPFTVSP